jgi:signal transduction histidine kinase
METLDRNQSAVLDLDLSHQTLLDLLPMAAYAVRAPDGVIVWFNSRAAELWGRRPVIGDLDERFCGAYRLHHPDGRYMAHSHTPVATALTTGTSVYEEDVVIERPNGSRVTVCVHIDPIRDGDGKIIGAVNFFYDVSERKAREIDIKTQAQQLELAVQQRTASLSALSCRLMRVQDEEWRRMSRELHDGLGQHLALAKINVDILAKKISSNETTLLNLAKEAQTRLETAIKETRTLSHLFHPPLLDELGFAAAVRAYAEGFSTRSGIKVKVEISAELERLTEHIGTALFRIVQESLTNIHRHSGASKATISVEMNDNILRLSVSDNGRGFDAEKSEAFGVGLTGIQERLRELQGSLKIQSGRGSRIIAEVPVNLRAKAQNQ